MTKTLLILALSLTCVVGCKKKSSATPVADPAQSPAAADAREKLPGASVVRDNLKNRNYGKAVEGLLVLRGLATGDQWAEYRELNAEVGQTLSAAAPTDPDAAKALEAYRLAVYGR